MIDPSDSKAIYDKIDRLRKERGWSIYKLAQEANISNNALYTWQKRDSSPSLYTLAGICQAFEISLLNLFADSDDFVLLTPEQKQLLKHWASLNAEQRKALLAIIKTI